MKTHPDYEILEELGRGPHGVVYRAQQKASGEFVAIKAFNDADNPARQQDLKASMALFADLPNYDHVVRILDVIPENGWLIMELLPGNLAERLRQQPEGLPPADVKKLLRQALAGLGVLHSKDRLHGNIQPSNILLDAKGRVRIGDSPGLLNDGVARPIEGLARYIAPERIDPECGAIGSASDLYALGMTTLHLLVGDRYNGLFPGTKPDDPDVAKSWLRIHGSPILHLPADELVPNLPQDLGRIIDGMIRKPVVFRVPTAADALRLLTAGLGPATQHEVIIDVEPIVPPTPPAPPTPPTLWHKLDTYVRSWSLTTWVFAGLCLALLGVVFGLLAQRPKIAEITINTVPSGAEITFLDTPEPNSGPSKSKTPGPYRVWAAKGDIRIRAEGHKERTETIDANKQTVFEFRLEPISEPPPPPPPTLVDIQFRLTPPDAMVWLLEGDPPVEKRLSNDDPTTLIRVPNKPLTVRIKAKDHQTKELTFDPSQGSPIAFVLEKMSPPPPMDRTVQITTVPPGAMLTISVGGQQGPAKKSASGPAAYSLPLEAVTVIARRDGFEEGRQDILANSTEPVMITLKRIPEIENSIGMKLRYIPDGQFDMGADDGDPNEQPVRKVKISRGFYMGKYEVTVAEFERVLPGVEHRGNPEYTAAEKQRFPVNGVKYADALEFATKLSKEEGKRYRLPTEAEWEYACRANTSTAFNLGAELKRGSAVFDAMAPGVPSPRHAAEIGSVGPPNDFGLHDMHGNVQEWVIDWFGPYNADDGRDPQGPATGTRRVLRGGSFRSPAPLCRSARRESSLPQVVGETNGFRIVLVVDD